MAKQVMLFDGSTLEFPDETSQGVMDRVAMEETAMRRKGQTDSTWRPVAQGVGATLGGVAASPGGPASSYAGMALGDAMGGQAYDAVMGAFRGDKQSVLDQAMKAASDVGWAGSVGPVADAAIPFAKQAIGAAVRPLTPTGILAGKLKGAQNVPQLAADLEAAGMRPTADILTNNPEMQALGQALRNMPGSGKVLRESDIANLEAAKDYAAKVAGGFGTPRTSAEMGDMLKGAATKTRSGMKDQFDSLYQEIEDQIPKDSLIPLERTKAFFDKFDQLAKLPLGQEAIKGIMPLREKFYQTITKETVNPATGEVMQYIDPQITAENARMLRSLWGDVFNKKADGIPEKLGKDLYRSIREDILAHAVNQGPEVAQALKETDAMYSAFKGNPKMGEPGNQDVLKGIMERDPGKAYEWATQGVFDKSSGGGRVAKMFGMLPEEVSGDVVATIIDQMGKATPGAQNADGDAFSFARFLTQYNRMSPETRQLLFGGNEDLARMARISDAVKSAEKFANTSNTSTNEQWRNFIKQPLNLVGLGAGVGAAPFSIPAAAGALSASAAKMGGQYLWNRQAAKLLTDPEIALWLAKGAPSQAMSVTPGLLGLSGIMLEDQARQGQ